MLCMYCKYSLISVFFYIHFLNVSINKLNSLNKLYLNYANEIQFSVNICVCVYFCEYIPTFAQQSRDCVALVINKVYLNYTARPASDELSECSILDLEYQ